MNDRYWVLLKILAITFISLLHSGCISSGDYISPDKQAKIWANQIIDCFENRDSATLQTMFSINAQHQLNLDEEISKAFNFIDGDIISHDEPSGTTGGGVIKPEGTVQKGVVGAIRHIVTDKGTTYSIAFSGYVIFDEDEDNLGICAITVRNVDLFNYYKDMNPRFYIDETKEADLVEIRINYGLL